MSATRKSYYYYKKVKPRKLYIRFWSWTFDPAEPTTAEQAQEYEDIVRQVLILMNTARSRTEILYYQDKEMLEFVFSYSGPKWGERALKIATALESLHSNCKVSLEVVEE